MQLILILIVYRNQTLLSINMDDLSFVIQKVDLVTLEILEFVIVHVISMIPNQYLFYE